MQYFMFLHFKELDLLIILDETITCNVPYQCARSFLFFLDFFFHFQYS